MNGEPFIRQRRHSRAGGGRNMCHKGLEHTSQVVGMWKLMATNSWPLWLTVPDFSSRLTRSGGGVLSSGFLDSPNFKNQSIVEKKKNVFQQTKWKHLLRRRWSEGCAEFPWHRHGWRRPEWRSGRERLCSSRGWGWDRRSACRSRNCRRRSSWTTRPRTASSIRDVGCFVSTESTATLLTTNPEPQSKRSNRNRKVKE